jgi:hypothetical protein
VSCWRHQEEQLSESRAGERKLLMQDYLRRVRRYRTELLEDRIRHVFIDPDEQPIAVVPPLKGRVTENDFFVRPRGRPDAIDGTRHVEALMAHS